MLQLGVKSSGELAHRHVPAQTFRNAHACRVRERVRSAGVLLAAEAAAAADALARLIYECVMRSICSAF